MYRDQDWGKYLILVEPFALCSLLVTQIPTMINVRHTPFSSCIPIAGTVIDALMWLEQLVRWLASHCPSFSWYTDVFLLFGYAKTWVAAGVLVFIPEEWNSTRLYLMLFLGWIWVPLFLSYNMHLARTNRAPWCGVAEDVIWFTSNFSCTYRSSLMMN